MRTRRSVRTVRPARALAGLLLAAAVALTGCGAGGDSGDAPSQMKDAAAAPGEADGATADAKEGAGPAASGARPGAASSAGPKLPVDHVIRTATLTVQVKEVSKALGTARTATENAGGYIGDETTTRDVDSAEQTRVVLRVPVEKYDDVLTALQGTGTLLERTAKAQDVGDQVVDVDSRVASQRASVARVRALMDRAAKLTDVVALEGELSRREADLEALLARQASLKDRTSMATVTLTLTETPVKEAAEDEDPGFLDALAGGWHALLTTLRWIAVAVGAVLPFAVPALAILLAWRRLRRARRETRPGEPAED
ncbi:DUF4349 domain-containing protein [Streptomyces sp. BK239]|uniref:DUF4349 domain-containing protein n=1 Tax=Streptomyces sp. BK239 TaxID=2512155 RepID=UPI00102B4B2B|nr:DUF4349 domain-containing protein [Streptomyces sp. BK239]RZU24006.1 uncharacterized protein DUF4349 [Streptomyces sp. BK239]